MPPRVLQGSRCPGPQFPERRLEAGCRRGGSRLYGGVGGRAACLRWGSCSGSLLMASGGGVEALICRLRLLAVDGGDAGGCVAGSTGSLRICRFTLGGKNGRGSRGYSGGRFLTWRPWMRFQHQGWRVERNGLIRWAGEREGCWVRGKEGVDCRPAEERLNHDAHVPP